MVVAPMVIENPLACEYVPLNVLQSALPLSVPSARKVMV